MAASVGRSVVLYACAFAVAGATPFVLLPILTAHLSPQQFGEVTSFLVFTALLGNAAGLSAHGFLSVRFFKVPAEGFRPLVSGSLLMIAGAHAAAFALVAAGAPLLARALELPTGTLLLAVAAALCLNVNLACLSIFQASGRPALYLALRVTQAAVEIALCITLLQLVRPDAGARVHSYTAALAASGALGALMCARLGFIGGRVQRSHLKALLVFGLPMLPHVVAGSAITYLDRLVVSSVLGPGSLGLYMVALQIGMAMIALVEPLNKALAPWLFERLARNDLEVRRLIVRRTYQLHAALAAAGIVVAATAMALFDVFIGAEFAAARVLVPWMVAGYVLQGMYYSVVNYLFYAERTGRLSVVSAATAAVGCVVSYTLTSAFGLPGAGASFVINNALLFVLVWAVAAHAVPMPWRPARGRDAER